MGAYHQLRAMNGTAPSTTLLTANDSAWAVGGGVKFNLPMIGHGDYAIVQGAYSVGVLSYVGSGINGGFNLVNNDATTHSVGQAFDAVFVNGGLDRT